MANYKESSITGTQWTRAVRVIINNPVNGIPTVHFQEETAIQTPSEVVTLPADVLVDEVDFAREIPLIDPETGSLTGATVSEGALYMALFSKYMALAAARDAVQPQPQQPPAAEPDPV